MHSLRRYVLGMAASVLALILLMGISIYTIVSRAELHQAVHSIRSLTWAMGERVDESSDAFQNQIDFVTLDGEIADSLEYMRQGALLPIDVRSVITMRIMSTNVVDGVYLYDTDGKIITKWVRFQGRADLYHLPDQVDPQWYDPSGRIRTELVNGNVVYNRTIRTLEDWHTAAYISFVYSRQELKNRLKLLAGEQFQSLMLYDSYTGTIIENSGENLPNIEKTLEGLDVSDCVDGKFIELEEVGEVLLCSKPVIRDGWFLLCAIKREDIFTGQSQTGLLALVFIGLGIILTASIYYSVGRYIVWPLVTLSKEVKKIQDGDYRIELEYAHNNELGLLQDSLKDMSRQIDALVNEKLKNDIASRDMQISLLRKQIKPHFLYNIFECINALAELGRIADVRRMTVCFTRLMKTMLEEKSFCTIEEELKCAEGFLDIYQIMGNGKLSYEIHMEEEYADVTIPVYLIQPIVENAVLHGIRKNQEQGNCSIHITGWDEWICIRISDDGCGIPKEKLKEIQDYAEQRPSDSGMSGIGLRNVIDRIWYIYKGNGKFKIYSDPEWGTSVELILPVQRSSKDGSS